MKLFDLPGSELCDERVVIRPDGDRFDPDVEQ